MRSAMRQRSASRSHRSSWSSTPSYYKHNAAPDEHAYYDSEPPRPPKPRSVLRSLRKGLCRFFGMSGSKTHHPNDSFHSLADSDDAFEAEMLEDENMAWGKPPSRKRRREKKGRPQRAPENPRFCF